MKPGDIMANLRERLDSSLASGSNEPAPPWPPSRVPDHELLRCIGRGNYGEVWLARSVTGQWRAVKVVWRRHFSHERPYEREFQGIVRYEPISRSHPGVVPVLHVGRDDAAGFFFYVMELADGEEMQIEKCKIQNDPMATSQQSVLNFELFILNYRPRTLRSDLKRRRRLSVGDTLHLGVQLARALGHLHEHELVHRDVKPSNVIYIQGRPRLADIGLVAGIDEARSFVGTEGFIAPEGPGTPQADLFALGKLLYEAATGRDRCDFPSLPEDLSEWPQHEAVLELNEVLARACSPNPRLRHASATELAADLSLLLAGRSIRHAYSIERRLRWIYHTVVAALVLALVAVGGMWFQRTRRADAEQRAAHELVLRQRAERAEAEKSAALRQALLEQARALVQSHTADRRSAALAVLRQAAAIAPGADLRTVGAAALAAPELREVHSWSTSDTDPFGPVLNPALDTYVRGDGRGVLMFHCVSDNSLVHTLTNGTSRVENVLFSPDGRWLVTADKETRLRLWSLEAGTNRVLAPSSTWILDFSCDSRLLYRFRSRGNLVREELATGERVEFPSGVESVQGMALHPRLPVAIVSQTRTSSLSVVSLENGGVIERVSHPRLVMSLAWNSTGNQLAAGCHDGSVWIWDWPLKSVPRHILRYHKRDVTGLSLHPDARWLVSHSWDGQSCLWDLENGQLSAVLRGKAWSFSADGKRLRFTQPGRGAVMEFDESFQPRQLHAHHAASAPAYLAFSPDGRWLVTGGEDGGWVWDLTNWKSAFRLTSDICGGVGFAENASQVIFAGPKRWQAWTLPSAESSAVNPTDPAAFNGQTTRVDHSTSDSSRNSENKVSITNETGRARLQRIELPWGKVATLLWAGVVEPRSGRWASFEEPPHGRGTVLRTGVVGSDRVKETRYPTKSGGNASISPDGRWAARGNWLDNDVWVLDLVGDVPPHCIPHRGNTATAFSSDSSEVLVCGEVDFRFVTVGTWRERLVIQREVPDSKPGRAAYAHNDSLVALLTSRSRIRLLRPEQGREYLTLSTHEGRHIEAFAFSPDDRFLVAAAPDHHLIIWDLEALRLRLSELGLNDELVSQ
jgi:WD40 repeat protein